MENYLPSGKNKEGVLIFPVDYQIFMAKKIVA